MNNKLLAIEQWLGRQTEDYLSTEKAIQIETLDNPGWGVRVDLKGTSALSGDIDTAEFEENADYWFHCSIAQKKFIGYGGVHNLSSILTCFTSWAGLPRETPLINPANSLSLIMANVGTQRKLWPTIDTDEPLERLEEWFYEKCDGDWEHESGVKIWSTTGGCWEFRISLGDADLCKKIPIQSHSVTDKVWYKTKIQDLDYCAICGPLGLGVAISDFLKWSYTEK
jgi:Immunity protein 53